MKRVKKKYRGGSSEREGWRKQWGGLKAVIVRIWLHSSAVVYMRGWGRVIPVNKELICLCVVTVYNLYNVWSVLEGWTPVIGCKFHVWVIFYSQRLMVEKYFSTSYIYKRRALHKFVVNGLYWQLFKIRKSNMRSVSHVEGVYKKYIRIGGKHNIAAYSICLSQSNFRISIRGRIKVKI